MTKLAADVRLAARPDITILHARTDNSLRVWTDTANMTTDRPTTLEDVRRSLDHAPAQLRSIAVLDGTPVATARAVPDLLRDGRSTYVSVRVGREHRRRGIGSALHADLLAWMRTHGRHTYETTVRDDMPDAMAFWAHRGCREVERDIVVALDVREHDAAMAPSPTPGVTVASLAERPHLLRAIYDVGAATWPDIPVHEPCTVIGFDRWRDIIDGHSENRPEGIFAAIVDREVVGYAHVGLPATTLHVAWHNFTGVLREHRGRGIAMALKLHVIEWARRHGRFTLMTGNHEDNAPMRRINEGLGYRYLRAEVTFAGSVE